VTTATRPLARLNNPVVFATAPVETHLDRYRAAGFSVSDHVADWEPGLRCGFVDLWPEYLEILTVADDAAFDRGADATLRDDRARRGIHAIELYSADTVDVHRSLTARAVPVPAVREDRLATTAPEAGPDFFFLDLPMLPGARVATMTSTFAGTAMRRFVKVAPNGVFALAGVSIVVDDPDAAAPTWDDIVEPGVHDLRFVTCEEWQAECPDAGDGGGVVCVHLASEDPERTAAMMVAAGWRRGPDIGGHRHMLPHPADDVRFTIRPGVVDDWRHRRLDVLGEHLDIRRPDPLIGHQEQDR